MSRSAAWHHLRQSVLDHADGTTCPWCSLPVATTATGPHAPVVEYQPPPAPEGVLVPFDMKHLRVAHAHCAKAAATHRDANR